MARRRMLSGMRPTGQLHIGHYFGVLENWVALQDQFECFCMVADWHALTTSYERPQGVRAAIREMIADWLAAGVDPDRAVLFVQSDVKEHAELALLLSFITPVSWLERNPSYKDMQEELKDRDLATHGFLGYPVLQAADIFLYKGEAVPIGKDQQAHLELTREIARRFNRLYGTVFPEPEGYLTASPAVPGMDGRKMSKSYGNGIFLGDSASAIGQKVKTMVTDPQKIRKGDPGRPEICPVYALHDIVSGQAKDRLSQDCRTGALGCVECKGILTENLARRLEGMEGKRRNLLARPEHLDAILATGAEKARRVAASTMHEVYRAVYGAS